jgi:hypothetical protein
MELLARPPPELRVSGLEQLLAFNGIDNIPDDRGRPQR